MSRLVYQSKHGGSYIVLLIPQGVQLGTVSKMDDGKWLAVTLDKRAQYAFSRRCDGGEYLRQFTSDGGCEPGCTCAEG